MFRKTTTAATLGRSIAYTLEAYGCDSRSTFEEVGLNFADSFDPSIRFSATKVTKLWRLAAKKTGDPAFGLKVPQYVSGSVIPALDLVIGCSDNLLQGLTRLTRFFALICDMGDLTLVQENDSISLEYQMTPENRALTADEAIDAFFASLLENIRKTLQPGFAVKRVLFVRQSPPDDSAYRDLFQAPVLFGQTTDKLEFDAQMLTTPLPSANPEIAKVNEQIVTEYLKRFDQNNIILQTRFRIIEQMQYGEPNQEGVAKLLNLSSRQLRRRLQEEDTNFSTLLQDTRHEMAKKYLKQHNLPISEITHLLGFYDQSNFSKAFKRREGVTPGAYRHSATICDD